MSDSERIYGEKEIRAILKRSADLQKETGGISGSGLSIAELRELAAESGIDSRFIDIAAAELAVSGATESGKTDFLGGPFTVTLDREIEGTVTDGLWEAVVAAARKSFKDSGQVSAWGKSLEWTYGGSALSSSRGHVSLSQKKDKLKLQVFWQDPTIPIPFFIILGLASVVATGISMSALGPALAIPLLVSILAPLYFLVRWIISRIVGKHRRRVTELTDTITRLCAEHQSDAKLSVPAQVNLGTGRIDDRLLDDVPDESDPIKRKDRFRDGSR